MTLTMLVHLNPINVKFTVTELKIFLATYAHCKVRWANCS